MLNDLVSESLIKNQENGISKTPGQMPAGDDI
jgi:hypothetical protein